jgi:hypothetical protein
VSNRGPRRSRWRRWRRSRLSTLKNIDESVKLIPGAVQVISDSGSGVDTGAACRVAGQTTCHHRRITGVGPITSTLWNHGDDPPDNLDGHRRRARRRRVAVTDQRYLITHQRTLQTIENRVLEEVSIGRVWRAVGGALAVALAGRALAWWLEVMGGSRRTPPTVSRRSLSWCLRWCRPSRRWRFGCDATVGVAPRRIAADWPR